MSLAENTVDHDWTTCKPWRNVSKIIRLWRLCCTSCALSDLKVDQEDNATFEFGKNCYSGASASDLTKVQTDCLPYHPSEVSCSDFYSLASTGQCLACPTNQVSSPDAGQCVCRIKGKYIQPINRSELPFFSDHLDIFILSSWQTWFCGSALTGRHGVCSQDLRAVVVFLWALWWAEC